MDGGEELRNAQENLDHLYGASTGSERTEALVNSAWL